MLESSPKQVSESLRVSVSTVYRTEHRFDTEGTVEKRHYPERQNGKVLSQNDEFFVLQLVIERPGIYLHEIRRELQNSGTDASITTIYRFLQKCGFTRTKIQAVALQQSAELRHEYMSELELYKPSMLVFVDETGTDRRDSLRRFGYSLRGKRTRAQKLLARGHHVSAIGAMSVNGILECEFHHGAIVKPSISSLKTLCYHT